MSDEAVVSSESVVSEDEASCQSPEVAAPPAASPRHKVKVDGEEMELELDEILKGYQKAQSSDRKFQEASRKEKQLQEALQEAKQNPHRFFELAGLDASQFAEKLLLEQLEDSLMSPEEKIRRQETAELDSYRNKAKSIKDQEEAAQREAAYEAASNEIEDEIISALTSSGLKPTPRTVARMAEQLLASLGDDGRATLKASEALSRVRSDYDSELSDFFAAQPSIEALLKVLPPSAMKLIQAHLTAGVKPSSGFGSQNPDRVTTNRKAIKNVAIELDDLFK